MSSPVVALLGHIKQAAEDACEFTASMGRDEFLRDRLTQRAVVMSLVIVGEAAARLMDVAPQFVDRYPQIPWRSMRSMRNRITHGYFAIDLDIVWDTVQTALPELIARLGRIDVESEQF